MTDSEANAGGIPAAQVATRELIAGAFSGLEAIRSDWVEKALRVSARDQEALARDLVGTALAKASPGS